VLATKIGKDVGSSREMVCCFRNNGLPIGGRRINLDPINHSMESTSEAYEIWKAVGGLVACFLGVALPALFLFTLVMAFTRKGKAWIVSAVVTGVLCLVLVVGMIVFGATRVVKSAKEGMEATSFVSADGLVSIVGAPGWRELDLDSPDADLSIGTMFPGEFLIVISELKTDFEEEIGIAEFAKIASDQVIGNVENAEASPLEPITVQGLTAYRQELSGTIDGTGIFYLNTYIEGAEHFHQVMAWTLIERKIPALPRLRTVSDSFQEMAPKPEPLEPGQ